MRHVIYSVLLIALLLSLCILSAVTVSGTIDQASAYLDQAVQAYGRNDPNATARYLELASEHWSKKQLLFGAVLQHDDVDQVTTEFARLLSYATSEDQDDFLSNCKALQATLLHIREMEWPHLQNIL